MARKTPAPRGPQLQLAGDLSVAFANTAAARGRNRQLGVTSYAELLAWGQKAGVTSALEAERLGRLAAERPAEAVAAFAGVAELRSLLRRLFFAVAIEKDLSAGDLRAFNAAVAAALPAQRLVPGERGLVRGWAGDEDALDRMIWPVLYAAFELLISTEGRPRIRQCGGEECRLYFVDRNPAPQRRWCEMKTCGKSCQEPPLLPPLGQGPEGEEVPWSRHLESQESGERRSPLPGAGRIERATLKRPTGRSEPFFRLLHL